MRRYFLASEAVAAIDRAVIARLEGNLAGLAAVGADSVEHLARRAGDAFAGIAAGFAALGLVGEALLGVKLLLTGGENEFLSAILADQGLVSVHEIPHSIKICSLSKAPTLIIRRGSAVVNLFFCAPVSRSFRRGSP